MRMRNGTLRGVRNGLAALTLLALTSCRYEQAGPPELHFEFFKSHAPVDDTVTVCSGYGCTFQTQFTFTADDIRQIAVIMGETRSEDPPAAERKSLGKAIAWIERRVGASTGTDRDRAGLDFIGAGSKSQQDCVDEATNTTSYMLVMERYALLDHHKVIRPVAKGNMIMGRWPHWGAMLEERGTGEKYAVDSFFGANGEPPLIMAEAEWYIVDDNPTVIALPPADPPERRMARKPAEPQDGLSAEQARGMPSADRGSLNRLFENVTRSPRRHPSALGYAR